jgi:hypothetical protein
VFKDFSTLGIKRTNTEVLNFRVATDVPEDDCSLGYDAVYAGDVHEQFYEECSKLLSNEDASPP